MTIINKGGYKMTRPPKNATPPGHRNPSPDSYVPLKLDINRLKQCRTNDEIWRFAVVAAMQIADHERTIDDLVGEVERLRAAGGETHRTGK